MDGDAIPPATAHGPPRRRVRVLVVDDLPSVCEAMKVLCSCDPDLEVVGQAHDGHEAVSLVEACKPDVVVMDVRMPGMNGLQATHAIKNRWPEVRVVLVTVYPTAREEPFANEADAILLKGFKATELLNSLFGAGGRPSSTLMSEGST